MFGGAVTLKNLTLTGGDAAIGNGGAISSISTALSLEDCLVFGNRVNGAGGGISVDGGSLAMVRTVVDGNQAAFEAGGVYVNQTSTATISNSKVIGNTAGVDGGGFFVRLTRSDISQSVTISRSVVSENVALPSIGGKMGSGGGIFADISSEFNPHPRLSIIDTTLDGNSAAADGGGVWACTKYGATFEAIRSTFSNNEAGSTPPVGDPTGLGGGIWLAVAAVEGFDQGRLTANLTNTTVSGNTAHKQGGGVWISHAMPGTGNGFGGVNTEFQFVTVTNNKAPSGGGLFSEVDAPAHRIQTTLFNTIVSGNTLLSSSTANNVAGDIEDDSSFNLLGSGGGATLPSTASPLFNMHSDAHGLAALADNGGPTLTHRPFITSPALDAGDPAVVFNPTEFDQRGPGFVRVFNIGSITQPGRGPVDVGAYELQAPKIIDVIVSSTMPMVNQTFHPPYSFATETYNGQPVVGSGNQLRTVPVALVDRIQIKFSEDVPGIASGNMTLIALGLTSSVPSLKSGAAGFGYNSTTRVATWTFSTPLPLNQYAIYLPDSLVGPAGNGLDGEWINPFSVTTTNVAVSEFPSGNGTAGGAFYFAFTILSGDANQNNSVDGMDQLIWQAHVGGSGGFTEGDFSGNGMVDYMSDYQVWTMNFGRVLQKLITADFDGDDDVDYDDYNRWVANWGISSGATHAQGDADHDGSVDNDDFLIWQKQFGMLLKWVA